MQHTPEQRLAVGLDSSKDTIDVVIQAFPEDLLWEGVVENRPAGYRALSDVIGQQASVCDKIPVVGAEDSRSYSANVVRYLCNEGLVVHEFNPRLTSRQRDFYGPDKSDHLDARCVASIVLRRDDLPVVAPADDVLEGLQVLQREYGRVTKLATQTKNQLHHALNTVYPGYQRHFKFPMNATALAVWHAYPTPATLANVDPASLGDLLRRASRGRYRGERAQAMAQQFLEEYQPMANCSSESVVAARALVIRGLVEQIQIFRSTRCQLKRELEQLLGQTAQTLTTMRGMGPVLAATILAGTRGTERFGNDRNRYARYNGTAPTLRASGRSMRHRPSRWCNRHPKNAFLQLARQTVMQGLQPSVDYFERQLQRGKTGHQARKLLARRLSDIVFAMMRNGTPYSPPEMTT